LVHTVEIETYGTQGQMVGEQVVQLRQDIDPLGPGIVQLLRTNEVACQHQFCPAAPVLFQHGSPGVILEVVKIRVGRRRARGGQVIRKMGISEQTFYRWKKKFGGLMPSEVRKLRQLEEENDRRRLGAGLSLYKEMLQEVIQISIELVKKTCNE
jgi:putative transposase